MSQTFPCLLNQSLGFIHSFLVYDELLESFLKVTFSLKMDSDSDISKIRGLIEDFSNAATVGAKEERLGKISRSVPKAFC